MKKYVPITVSIVCGLLVLVAGISFYYSYWNMSSVQAIKCATSNRTDSGICWMRVKYGTDKEEIDWLNSLAGAMYFIDAENGDKANKVITFLKSRGLDINATSTQLLAKEKLTGLHSVAILGSADATRLLLTHGANPYLKDAKGRTPLEAAEEAAKNPKNAQQVGRNYPAVVAALKEAMSKHPAGQ